VVRRSLRLRCWLDAATKATTSWRQLTITYARRRFWQIYWPPECWYGVRIIFDGVLYSKFYGIVDTYQRQEHKYRQFQIYKFIGHLVSFCCHISIRLAIFTAHSLWCEVYCTEYHFKLNSTTALLQSECYTHIRKCSVLSFSSIYKTFHKNNIKMSVTIPTIFWLADRSSNMVSCHSTMCRSSRRCVGKQREQEEQTCRCNVL